MVSSRWLVTIVRGLPTARFAGSVVIVFVEYLSSVNMGRVIGKCIVNLMHRAGVIHGIARNDEYIGDA